MQTLVNKRRIGPGMSLVNFTLSRLYTMKLKCNWSILHGYILEPSLNPFKAHIELQMTSYVNVKAIKLITLFVGFVQVYKTPGILPNL